ncbi:MAG TPA: hypothetical protein VHE61_06410 [Opitutaceae bacterium]|nr:hypothetical protein [Opitutaceae bacterium]
MSGPNLHELYEELRAYQRRLGTASESGDDFDRVLRLAHEINNQLAAKFLAEPTSTEADPQRTLVALSRKYLR